MGPGHKVDQVLIMGPNPLGRPAADSRLAQSGAMVKCSKLFSGQNFRIILGTKFPIYLIGQSYVQRRRWLAKAGQSKTSAGQLWPAWYKFGQPWLAKAWVGQVWTAWVKFGQPGLAKASDGQGRPAWRVW